MKILYIGQYNDGSTSKMRGEYIRKILNPEKFIIINTDIPISNTPRLLRSIGWRYKIGPFIHNLNAYIKNTLDNHSSFDLVWIDKGVFISMPIIYQIRAKSSKMIHFTPDPAFFYHQSNLFYQAIPYYDHCITTKSFEIDQYKAHKVKSIMFCTQGYDPLIHKPYHSFEEKSSVVFIGHKEDDREDAISGIIEQGISFKLAGINWGRLAARYKKYKNFKYYGNGVFGDNYAKLLSSGLIALGFLSKIIPEQHTTRTFEIPACRTALVTERNNEIQSIYNKDEVLFYDNVKDLVEKVSFVYYDHESLFAFSQKGYEKVLFGKYDYESILRNLIRQIYPNQ